MKKIISLILLLAMLSVVMLSCKKTDPSKDPTQQNPAVNVRSTVTAE